MQWCRLNDEAVVVETTTADPEGRYVAAIAWHECPVAVAPGWLFHGDVFSPPPDPLPVLDDYRRAIQAHLDETASQRQYDSGVTCASYANSTVSAWSAEANTFIAWRDAVWAHAYSELAKVENDEREQPSVVDLLTELPSIEWPASPIA